MAWRGGWFPSHQGFADQYRRLGGAGIGLSPPGRQSRRNLPLPCRPLLSPCIGIEHLISHLVPPFSSGRGTVKHLCYMYSRSAQMSKLQLSTHCGKYFAMHVGERRGKVATGLATVLFSVGQAPSRPVRDLGCSRTGAPQTLEYTGPNRQGQDQTRIQTMSYEQETQNSPGKTQTYTVPSAA